MTKDLCIRETYERNGEERTSWNKIGILIESNGKQYVKLFHIPGQLISVFEQKDKDGNPKPAQASAQQEGPSQDEWEN